MMLARLAFELDMIGSLALQIAARAAARQRDLHCRWVKFAGCSKVEFQMLVQ